MAARRGGPSRVVFLVLDGLPPTVVGPELTPTLLDWAAASGTRPSTLRAVLPASTYPNHATFVTGVGPARHGISGNWVRTDRGFRRAAELGPAAPTIFDAARAADVESALVVGDQELVGVMGGRAASTHWPPDGVVPDGATLDAHGYLDDSITLPQLLAGLEGDAQLFVGHLNSPDTAGHVHGPDAPGARDVYRAVDQSLAQVRDAIAARADDTVTIVVSDHSMEPVTVDEPIDLSDALDGLGLEWFPEGSAAVVYGEHPDAERVLMEEAKVAGILRIAPHARVVWAEPGRWLCFHGLHSEPGQHGGPRTALQLAAVLGTHPAVQELDACVNRAYFDARSWALAIADMLRLPPPPFWRGEGTQ